MKPSIKIATRLLNAAFVGLVVVLQMLPGLNACQAADRPNVVILLADDQGWGDLSLHGNANLETPHLDSIALQGARFEQFFVCPVCAPTRAEFLTGRYYPRTGVQGVSRGEERLNANEVTIADLFEKAGYATGAFGKWHNGTQPPLHPIHRGFQEFYGFTSGHWSHYFDAAMDHNNRRVQGTGFIANDITNHAIDFITRSRHQPFLCYVGFNTPHSPMMVPDRHYAKFKDAPVPLRHRDPEKEDLLMTRAALALCDNLDWNVGRILKTLDQQGTAGNTIVVYFSDNGPNSWRWNGGLKGKKGSIDEGGVKSPLFVRWPAKIQAGKRVDTMAGAIDLLPTLCSLAGVPVRDTRPLDGMDLSAWLLSDALKHPDRCLFSVRRNQVSVRSQRFRLDAQNRLFDMSIDPGQTVDVANRHPATAAELRQQAVQFKADLAKSVEADAPRPFHLGYGTMTMLPARDAVASGLIQRSSKAPNHSFFKNWVRPQDTITWSVQVGSAATYEFVLLHTCPANSVGTRVSLSVGDQRLEQSIQRAFDPPLYDKSKERVPKSHYHMKDFRPQTLGRLELPQGPATLTLGLVEMPGPSAIDVFALDVSRVSDGESTDSVEN